MKRTETLEKNWMVFLHWIKDNPKDGMQVYDPVEQDFWQWYLDTKMKASE